MNLPQLASLAAAAVVLGLLLFGIGLFWLGNALVLARGGTDRRRPWLLDLIAWASLAVGLLGVAAGLLSFVAIPLLLLAAIVFPMAIAWFRRSEADALLWSIGQALRHHVDLEQAARALGAEGGGRLGHRARQLADRLAAGVPPALAMQSFIAPSDLDARVLIEVSALMNKLPHDVLVRDEASDDLRQTLLKTFETAFYLIATLAIELGILVFFALRILPVITDLFFQFNLRSPAIYEFWSQLNLWGIDAEQLFMVFAACVWLALGLAAVPMLQSNLAYVDLPIFARFGKPLDRARVLSALSLGVRHHLPLATMCEFLARSYPKHYLRRRLARAAGAINSGQDPWVSLQREGLLSAGDAGFLRSGQRVGNLGWTLREQSHIIRRRYANRQRVVLQLLMPLGIVITAVAVLLLSSGLYLVLAQLAEALS